MFEELLIMTEDGTLIKRFASFSHIPNVDDLIYIDREYVVISRIFNYNLHCINIYVKTTKLKYLVTKMAEEINRN